MKNIYYCKGDATDILPSCTSFILHICNNKGGWGRGFTKSLSAKWDQPEEQYRLWFKGKADSRYQLSKFGLGEYQKVWVEDSTFVINMIAQEGYSVKDKPAINYTALKRCLKQIATEEHSYDPVFHMPAIGTGLAGGSWSKIEPIIQSTLVEKDRFVVVYARTLDELKKLGA